MKSNFVQIHQDVLNNFLHYLEFKTDNPELSLIRGIKRHTRKFNPEYANEARKILAEKQSKKKAHYKELVDFLLANKNKILKYPSTKFIATLSNQRIMEYKAGILKPQPDQLVDCRIITIDDELNALIISCDMCQIGEKFHEIADFRLLKAFNQI